MGLSSAELRVLGGSVMGTRRGRKSGSLLTEGGIGENVSVEGSRKQRAEPNEREIVERDTRTQHEDDDDDTTATRTNDHLARSMQQDARLSCPFRVDHFPLFFACSSHYRQVEIGGKTRSNQLLLVVSQQDPRGYYYYIGVSSNVSENSLSCACVLCVCMCVCVCGYIHKYCFSVSVSVVACEPLCVTSPVGPHGS